MTVLLAIDTSSKVAGIALLDGDTVLGEATWQARGNHTTRLLPAVRHLLSENGLEPSHLGAVAVAIGPGAFSGLRVGIATAKALTWALHIPCVGVGSLDALAASMPWASRVLAVLDAGRGDWYWALYKQEPERMRRLAGPNVDAPEIVLAQIPRGTLLVGDYPLDQRALIEQRFARQVVLGNMRLPAVRPAALGLVAVQRLGDGAGDEPATLQPVYLRRPAAEERRVDGAKRSEGASQ